MCKFCQKDHVKRRNAPNNFEEWIEFLFYIGVVIALLLLYVYVIEFGAKT
jgi:hypothetical protein